MGGLCLMRWKWRSDDAIWWDQGRMQAPQSDSQQQDGALERVAKRAAADEPGAAAAAPTQQTPAACPRACRRRLSKEGYQFNTRLFRRAAILRKRHPRTNFIILAEKLISRKGEYLLGACMCVGATSL